MFWASLTSSGHGRTSRSGLYRALEPSAAFDAVVKELADALTRLGIDFAAGPNGRVIERGFEVGRVLSWKPGERILMQWRPAESHSSLTLGRHVH